MVEGTVKGLSLTKELGFVAPHDGSRDVFVRFSSGENSDGTSGEHQDGSLVNEVSAHTAQRGDGVESHLLVSRIEVGTRDQVARDSDSRVGQ
jgi:cold shock CspA family protein